MSYENLLKQFRKTRKLTESICEPLAIEDYVVQPMPNVSPPKWHLAHTTWFFEQFILTDYQQGYQVFDADFAFLFNSYYNNKGAKSLRHHRGFMTRPTVTKIMQYRAYVTDAIVLMLTKEVNDTVLALIEIGIHHEQQHQELLVYDIKYILGTQPTFPALGPQYEPEAIATDMEWINVPGGLYDIGHRESTFSFDNEQPVHQRYLDDFSIHNRLVTNGEFLEFMEDGGYKDFNLWLDEGWHFVQKNSVNHPLYWHQKDGEWWHYTYTGLQKIDPQKPVMHLSFYEANAFAEWKGMRLPTEFEWEIAAPQLEWGQLWEWTYSAYLPYPEYTKVAGALGEYNGKFMLNQMVLRGASVATPAGHQRITYRNFYHASSRWIFSGVRLAKK